MKTQLLIFSVLALVVTSCEVARKEESSSGNTGNVVVSSPHAEIKNPGIGLKTGQQAPDISLPDTEGNIKTLSSLRGKYVLLDFWASWCGPCRFENPNVVRVYQKYKEKDFDIFSVSLDRDKKAWLAAIEADGMEWNHVSDLKMWESQVIPVYHLDAIPMTYLLDKDGIIIEKNLRGKDLENKIMELLEK